MVEGGAARLTPYVSRLVLEWGATTPDQRYRRLKGTLAFCDLSGFTAMSEKLAKLGRLGAEELAEILNGIFSALLADAASFGGSLLKYGGDALLLFFDGDGHAARAAAATHRMRATLRTLGRVRTSQGTVRVRMSVGVHSGSFDFFLVGESHRELIVAGAGATECCDMETAADAGEILLSPSTAAALAPSCVGEAKGAGFLLKRVPRVDARAPLRAPDAAVVDPTLYVPVALRAHVGDVGVDAEHRHIAVGFIAFGGVDDLIEQHGDAVAETLDEFVATCQFAFDTYGCTFLYADVYGDGGKIFFIVGAPVAHEDNEERALRACRAINAAHHAGLYLHTGVNRGYVFAGDIGASFRRTYTVLGDAVNTAARVMASCDEDGQIRALPEVLQVATSRYEAVEQPPFAAKGKAEPIVSYAVGAPLGPRTPDTPLPLVGREEELARLRAAMAQVATGEPVLLSVLGEAGVGKSRLVAELRAELARDSTWTVAATYGERYEQTTPFVVVRRLLADLLHEDSDAFRTVSSQIDTAPDVNAASLAVLGVLDGIDGNLLFLLENAHLADAASNELIAAIASAATGRRWALIRVARDEAAEPDDVVLGPLSDEAAIELARSADPSLLPYDAGELAKRSGGNPLFLRQLVAAHREGSALGESVETAIATRIDTLAPELRDVLRIAAVLGGRFELATLEALVQGRRPDYAALGDFIALDGAHAIFRQALYRDVAYEGLTFRRRRALHLAAGRLLERQDPAAAARLSLHFDRAQAWPESWKYSQLAGAAAYSTAAKAAAATFFARAVTAGRHVPTVSKRDLAKLHSELGLSLYHAGFVDQARAAYAKGRKYADRGTAERAELELNEAVSYQNAGDATRAQRWYRRALATLGNLDDSLSDAAAEVAVTAFVGLGGLFGRRGEFGRAYASMGAAREVARGNGSQRLLGLVHNLGVVLALSEGDLASAAAAARLALEAFRADGRYPGHIGDGASNLGTIVHALGDWAEAAPLLQEGYELQLAAGNAAQAASAQANLAEVLIDQGQWDRAAREIAESDRVLRLVASASVAFTELLRRRLLLRTGQPDPGISAEAVAALADLGLSEDLASVEVEAALVSGDRVRARELLGSGRDELRLFAAFSEAIGAPVSDDVIAGAFPLARVIVRVLRGGRLVDDPEAGELGIVDVPRWATASA